MGESDPLRTIWEGIDFSSPTAFRHSMAVDHLQGLLKVKARAIKAMSDRSWWGLWDFVHRYEPEDERGGQPLSDICEAAMDARCEAETAAYETWQLLAEGTEFEPVEMSPAGVDAFRAAFDVAMTELDRQIAEAEASA